MFCTNCGREIEGGKAFCRYCGAPVLVPSVEEPEVVSTSPEEPAVPPPAAPPVVFPPPPGPGRAGSREPGPAMPSYGGSPPPRKSRGGLIAGIVAAAIIVLAGAGVGVYFGFFWEKQDDSGVASTTSSGPKETVEATGSTALATDTTLLASTTTQTIPARTTSTSVMSLSTTTSSEVVSTTFSTTTTEDPVEVYLEAAGVLVAALEEYDARIPELAEIINKTLPNVPKAVTDELADMLTELDGLTAELALVAIPRPFKQADYWLEEAVRHMATRIDDTIQGVEAARAAGKVDANATAFFDDGRKARDSYRAAMRKYHETLPVE